VNAGVLLKHVLPHRPLDGLQGHATPRFLGRRPNQRLRPAFPCFSRLWSVFETIPMVALQVWRIIRVSPEGILMMANLPSRDISWRSTCRTYHLGSLTRTEFNVMDHSSKRYLAEDIVFPISGGTPLPRLCLPHF